MIPPHPQTRQALQSNEHYMEIPPQYHRSARRSSWSPLVRSIHGLKRTYLLLCRTHATRNGRRSSNSLNTAETLERNIEKVMQWWSNQPDTASRTVQQVSVAMGLDPQKLRSFTTDELVIKVMTAALTVSS